MKMLAEDLRSLDAHSHLGNFAFESDPSSDAPLPGRVGHRRAQPRRGLRRRPAVGHVDNRPFLRCLHGVGLCFWRLGDLEQAAKTFTACSGSTVRQPGERFNLATSMPDARGGVRA